MAKHGGARTGAGRPKGIPGIKSGYLADKIRNSIHVMKAVQTLNAALNGENIPQSRMKAVEIALRKTVPDLSATELSGEVARPTVIRAPATVSDSRSWLDQYGPQQEDMGTVRGSDEPKPN